MDSIEKTAFIANLTPAEVFLHPFVQELQQSMMASSKLSSSLQVELQEARAAFAKLKAERELAR